MRRSQTLEDLLAGNGRIGVLRALVRAECPLTGRQIAAASGLSHAGAGRILTRLCEAGLVTRRAVGRAMLHELDRGDPVVQQLVVPLFETETMLLGLVAPPSSSRGSAAAQVNVRVRPYLSEIEDACRRHHVTSSALFGSATQVGVDIVPNDLDVLVTFSPLAPRVKAEEYAALTAELEAIMGMPVDVMVSTAIRNPYLAEEIDRTKVVLFEAA